jgi:8-oxo-dGTP pyrophosphatase MutT (NUDIX family)
MRSETVHAAGIFLMTRSTPTRFLLMKHKNRWDLPKGHADKGETLVETALRETEEETGIKRKKIALDESFEFWLEYEVSGKKRGDYLKRSTYFLGFVDDACEIKLTEHIGYEWMAWPPAESIQAQTIDPLIAAVAEHLAAEHRAADN